MEQLRQIGWKLPGLDFLLRVVRNNYFKGAHASLRSAASRQNEVRKNKKETINHTNGDILINKTTIENPNIGHQASDIGHRTSNIKHVVTHLRI